MCRPLTSDHCPKLWVIRVDYGTGVLSPFSVFVSVAFARKSQARDYFKIGAFVFVRGFGDPLIPLLVAFAVSR